MSAATDEKKEQGQGAETLQHRRSRRGLYLAVAVVVVVILIVAYVVLSGVLTPSSSTPSQSLDGAGATFPQPLITLWTQQYANITGAPSYGTKVNYQGVGSGTGITDLQNKIVDFAASDAPLQPKDRANNPNLAMGAVLHIPETIGAATFAYNLPGVATGLNMTGQVLVHIFLGQITKWNDPNITTLNPGVSLPDQPISVVHRSDSSGTSFVWTSFLHASNATAWNTTLVGKSINWPTGVGKSGNAGVAGQIVNTPYSAGYVELAYVIQNSMTVAKIENPAGVFVAPSLASTAAAAAAASPSLPAGIGDWANVSILNAPGASSYPVATFTYFLVYKELSTLGSSETQARAQALVNWLWWVVHDGQSYSSSLSYVPLPQSVVTVDETSINSLTFNGQALVHG
jgi:phosphate ABC transporter phosphate-binding protein